MSLREELKDRRERQTESLAKIYEDIRERQAYIDSLAVELEDLDRAIAALEPAPAAPEAEPLPTMDDITDPDFTGGMTSEQYLERLHGGTLTGDPAVEGESGRLGDVLPEGFMRWWGGECPVPRGTIVDIICRDPEVRVGQTNQVFAHMIHWENEGNPAYDIIAYRVVESQSEGETHTDDVRTAEGETVAGDDRIETQSITSDPDFVAAVERAEAKLAIDAQTCEPIYPHPQPAYVGLQDPELDAEYEAMREREKADKPKLHFSIFGERGNRKLEDVE